MQMAATPHRSPEATRLRASVPRMRVPDAPSGWPIAIAPPWALTIAGSMPQALMQASAWAAKHRLEPGLLHQGGVGADRLVPREIRTRDSDHLAVVEARARVVHENI
jgi:hypothetical protein